MQKYLFLKKTQKLQIEIIYEFSLENDLKILSRKYLIFIQIFIAIV